MKSIRSLSLAALFAVAAFFTTTLTAKDDLPFRGAVETVENNTVVFPTVFVNLQGVGEATHLGRFTMSMQGTVNLLTHSGAGMAELVAADGSRLFTNFIGRSTPTGVANQHRIVQVFTIISGNGRFGGATGSFTMDRLSDGVTGLSEGTLSGTVSPAKGNSP